jgi:hypothetical protein
VIYFFRVVGTEDVKVGFTNGDPLSRMGALQTGNPYQLACVGLMFGMMEDEKRIHRMLASRRTRGEFFQLSSEEVHEIVCTGKCSFVPNDFRDLENMGELSLRRVAEWFLANQSLFPLLVRDAGGGWKHALDGVRARDVLGYVAGDEVWFSPVALRVHLEKCRFSPRIATRSWAKAGYLIREGKSLQPKRSHNRRRVGGERRRYVVLRRDCLAEVLAEVSEKGRAA